mmetsp:Transcript_30304/g.50158  ORF Transcript_30304/g.50158 Transcript_30304/m.50158 type:complete len:129 (+) Transcript_30304:21-407(+)
MKHKLAALLAVPSLTHAFSPPIALPAMRLPRGCYEPRFYMARTVAYYETIDGVKYDAAALGAAREAVAGEGDGRVSKADAKAIIAKLLDGDGVTAIEYRTAFKILADYKFTPAAKTLFIAELSTSPLQ